MVLSWLAYCYCCELVCTDLNATKLIYGTGPEFASRGQEGGRVKGQMPGAQWQQKEPGPVSKTALGAYI